MTTTTTATTLKISSKKIFHKPKNTSKEKIKGKKMRLLCLKSNNNK